MNKTPSQRASQIKLIILDVDGVLTNGQVILDDSGQQYKAFNIRDGQGLRLLQDSGIEAAIITGRTSNVVLHRAKELGIAHIYQGQKNKLEAFEKLLNTLNLNKDQVAYVGDDIIDLPVMRQVGLACAVRDAEAIVKQYAHYITPRNGGQGAVRDVCEFIMRSQNTLEHALKPYLN